MVMGQLTTKTDVAVIGGGPGGYTAAIRAAQLGLEVVLIEKHRLGGICTNTGCIPSKALIHAADIIHDAQSPTARDIGIKGDLSVDFEKTQKWKDGIVDSLRDGLGTLLSLNGVEVVMGKASFTKSTELMVETESGIRMIEFKKAILASGSRRRELPALPLDHKRIINSADALNLIAIPKRLVIVGGGYVTVEMANMFSKFGSKVSIVYRGERLLKLLEPEATNLLEKRLMDGGIDIFFKSEIKSVKDNEITITSPLGEKRIGFDRLLIAIGRVPELEGIGLENTRVKIGQDESVIVDEACKTTDENIYAVGDITSGPKLAHKAFRQGKVAAECIAGRKSAYDNRTVPMVVFSDPEIAATGLTEEEAGKAGIKMVIGRAPLTASGAAKVSGSTIGFVKVIANEDGIILGVHAIGEEAKMLIAEATLAIEMGGTLEDLATTIHAHPTMPEALQEAVEDALGSAIHMYRKRKN